MLAQGKTPKVPTATAGQEPVADITEGRRLKRRVTKTRKGIRGQGQQSEERRCGRRLVAAALSIPGLKAEVSRAYG